MPTLEENQGIFLPVQVGKTLTDVNLNIQPDNELNGRPCDNISGKHFFYGGSKTDTSIKYILRYFMIEFYGAVMTNYFSRKIKKFFRLRR